MTIPQRKCFYVNKPCNDKCDQQCEPYPWQKGKSCFPTAEEFVEHFKREIPHVTANQVRHWYSNQRKYQISMYPDKPLTQEENS